MLATSYDLRYCRDSFKKGGLLRLVFTELLATEYPHTRRRLATLFYAFADARLNGITVIHSKVLHLLKACHH